LRQVDSFEKGERFLVQNAGKSEDLSGFAAIVAKYTKGKNS
jgi:hypothetical protein